MPTKAALVSALLCCIIQVAQIAHARTMEYSFGQNMDADSEKRLDENLGQESLVTLNGGTDEGVDADLERTLDEGTNETLYPGMELESVDITRVMVEVELEEMLKTMGIQNITNNITHIITSEKAEKFACDAEVRVVALLVPDGDNALNASWSLRDPCEEVIQYKVFFRQFQGPMIYSADTVDTTMLFQDLKGCTLFTLEVFAMDNESQIVGREGHDVAYTEILVPEVMDLTLNASLTEITADWPPVDPTCFPGIQYRVTSTDADQIIAEKHFVMSGLACETSYDVTVTPVRADGTDGVPANGTITTETEVIAMRVVMSTPDVRSLAVSWDPVESSCRNITGYILNFGAPGGGPRGQNYSTTKTYYNLGALTPSTLLEVHVLPLDENGLTFGAKGTAIATTQTATGYQRCPYPTLEMRYVASRMWSWCVGVIFPPQNSLIHANTVCAANPFPNKYSDGNLYRANPSFTTPHTTLIKHLKNHYYTEKIMVNAFWSNGWKWSWQSNGATVVAATVDPALLVDVPAGGDGPNDYKYLYLDPAKDFGLSAAKDLNVTEAVLCTGILKTS